MIVRIIRGIVAGLVAAVLIPNIFQQVGAYSDFKSRAGRGLAEVSSAFKVLTAKHSGTLNRRAYPGEAGQPVDCRALGLDPAALSGFGSSFFSAEDIRLERLKREAPVEWEISVAAADDPAWHYTLNSEGQAGGRMLEAEVRERWTNLGWIVAIGLIVAVIPIRLRRRDSGGSESSAPAAERDDDASVG